MWARIGWLLAAVLASFALTGAGQVSRSGSGPEDTAAARAVAIITGIDDDGRAGAEPAGRPGSTAGRTVSSAAGSTVSEAAASGAIPADFAEVMGFEPRVVTGPDGTMRVIEPDGDCSSPFGATTYDFDFACKAHDYGYSLLRYADAKDAALGPWARIAIDDQFGSDLRDRCDLIDRGAGCRAAAEISESVVKVNSWRQGQGIPGEENPAPYLASGALILLAVSAPPAVARIRRAASLPRHLQRVGC